MLSAAVPNLASRDMALVETYRSLDAVKGGVRLTIFRSGHWESVEEVDRKVTARHSGHLPEDAVQKLNALLANFRATVESNGWVEPSTESDPTGMSAVRGGARAVAEQHSPAEGLPAAYKTLFEGIDALLSR